MTLFMSKQASIRWALSLLVVGAGTALTGKEPVGVGAKVPKGAEVLFDGSRKMLDEKWTYWQGPRLAATLPIKWNVEKDPAGDSMVMNSNDPSAAGGKYGAADIVTKEAFRDFQEIGFTAVKADALHALHRYRQVECLRYSVSGGPLSGWQTHRTRHGNGLPERQKSAHEPAHQSGVGWSEFGH